MYKTIKFSYHQFILLLVCWGNTEQPQQLDLVFRRLLHLLCFFIFSMHHFMTLNHSCGAFYHLPILQDYFTLTQPVISATLAADDRVQGQSISCLACSMPLISKIKEDVTFYLSK